MKQLKFLAMALVAFITSIGFVACSNDDNNDNDNHGGITSGKKLAKIIDSDGTNYTFTYDAEGRLTKATEDDYYITASWSTNTVTIESHYNGGYHDPAVILSLSDNKITSYVSGIYEGSVTYSGNFLKKFEDESFQGFYTWENGNISKYKGSQKDVYEGTSTCTYYTDKANKHPIAEIYGLDFNLIAAGKLEGLFLLAHPNLLGTMNKNLLKSVTDESGYTENYAYDLDKDGYPTKITKTSSSGQTRTCALIWE